MIRTLTYILFLALCLNSQMNGQVIYDTIPSDTMELGSLWFDEMIVFRDSSDLFLDDCSIPDLPTQYQKYGTVYISTVFGKNGLMKNTRVVRSVNPIYDSNAFYCIQGLKGWIPGMLRGHFIDIPFTFPVKFEDGHILNQDRLVRSFKSNISIEKYLQRKRIFEFLNSDDPNQPIITNNETFKYFLTSHIDKEEYTYVHKYSPPNLFKMVILKTNLNSRNDKLYLVYKNHKYSISEVNNPKRLFLEKDRNYIAVVYRIIGEGRPQVSIKPIQCKNRCETLFEFENYSKGQLIQELNKYVQ